MAESIDIPAMKNQFIDKYNRQITQLNHMIKESNDERMISVFNLNIEQREEEINTINNMDDNSFYFQYYYLKRFQTPYDPNDILEE